MNDMTIGLRQITLPIGHGVLSLHKYFDSLKYEERKTTLEVPV